jgi:hypothetical protein
MQSATPWAHPRQFHLKKHDLNMANPFAFSSRLLIVLAAPRPWRGGMADEHPVVTKN